VALALFVPGWFVLVRPLCKAGLREYTLAALRPMVLATVAIAPGYFLAQLMNGVTARLLIGAVVAVPLYLWLSHMLNREWIAAMLQLVGRGRGAAA
jgi:PST family polysaccharide transporter/teichuronic acid exporter/lipopolysaccharide exporter